MYLQIFAVFTDPKEKVKTKIELLKNNALNLNNLVSLPFRA